MRRPNPILIVTGSAEVRRLITAVLEPHPVRVVPIDEASVIVASEILGGLVVDVPSSPTRSRQLVREYLHRQPLGRVAVLSDLDDVTTLTAFAWRDGRLDMFFEPWNVELLREFLGAGVPSGLPDPAAV